MAKGVFLHRADSIYDDEPETRYQFPRQYLKAARQCIGDWIIYLEPVKAGVSGYHAVAQVADVVEDNTRPGMFLALMVPGTYLPFETMVAFRHNGQYPEASVLNEAGRISGRAQAAMRVIPDSDFNRILSFGIPEEDSILPRTGETLVDAQSHLLAEARQDFIFEQQRDRAASLTNRIVRDRVFRLRVLDAYGGQCAFTGTRFVNGGGRLEAEAAHIRPVSDMGPDIVSNGLALSGTVHWMFDRGLLSMADDGRILISHAVNDRQGIDRLLVSDQMALLPQSLPLRPHPRFLEWHRRERFKV